MHISLLLCFPGESGDCVKPNVRGKEAAVIKFRFSNLVKVILPFLLALLQPHARTVSAHAAMIGVDDHIDGMLLTTGAADARPL